MGLRMIRVSNQCFAEILVGTPGHTSNMPRDLEVMGCLQSDLDRREDCLMIIARSADWEDHKEGAAIPQIEAIFTLALVNDG